MNDLQIIYEDNHLIAVNKRSGDLVHGDKTGDEALESIVKHYIKVRYGKPGDVWLGTLHRLDRPVSGVTIFARTSKAAERMSQLFQKKQIKKIYYAITKNRPEPLFGNLKHYIAKDEVANKVKAKSQDFSGAKLAELNYEMVAGIDDNVLIKIELLTGRPHQARAQLAKIGCPINGDHKYGSTVAYPDRAISLHCRQMSFIHPVTKENVTILAEPPLNHLWRDFNGIL
jgi:23S rRNA pseudouridine1911/1915/1917 synthase